MMSAAQKQIMFTPGNKGSSSVKDPRSLEKHALEAIMMMKREEVNKCSDTVPTRLVVAAPTIENDSLKATSTASRCATSVSTVGTKPAFTALLEAVKTNQPVRRRKIRAALGLRAGPWTKKEDALLRKAVEDLSKSEDRPQYFWTKVAESVPFRDNEQCRNRWRYHVNPEICTDPFSSEEFAFFLDFQNKKGNQWTELGRLMKGR